MFYQIKCPHLPPFVFETSNDCTTAAVHRIALDKLNHFTFATVPRRRLPKGYELTNLSLTHPDPDNLKPTDRNEWRAELNLMDHISDDRRAGLNQRRVEGPTNRGLQKTPLNAIDGHARPVWWVCHTAAVDRPEKERSNRETVIDPCPAMTFACLAPAPSTSIDQKRARQCIVVEWIRRVAAYYSSTVAAPQYRDKSMEWPQGNMIPIHADGRKLMERNRIPGGSRVICTWAPALDNDQTTCPDHVRRLLDIDAVPPILLPSSDSPYVVFPIPASPYHCYANPVPDHLYINEKETLTRLHPHDPYARFPFNRDDQSNILLAAKFFSALVAAPPVETVDDL